MNNSFDWSDYHILKVYRWICSEPFSKKRIETQKLIPPSEQNEINVIKCKSSKEEALQESTGCSIYF
jgi:hypothetical protein